MRETSAMLVGFVGIVAVASGCSHSRPAFPPAVDPAIYNEDATDRPGAPDRSLRMGVVGLRIAEGGLYMDLAIDGAWAEVRHQARAMAEELHYSDSPPSRFIELRDWRGQTVDLRYGDLDPRDVLGFSLLPVSWIPGTVAPPTYELKRPDGGLRIIQVLMFQTGTQLKPGR
jgi:hypothetical protein